jgi:predicted dehydrogenase
MIRTAVIGAGSIVKEIHIPAWQAISGVELAVICDVDRARAQALAVKTGVPLSFGSIDEISNLEPPINVVDIATPPHTHQDVARRALELGCHVIIEKPAALSAEGVLLLSELARQRGLQAWTAHSYRYRDSVLRADHARSSGRLGMIEQVTIRSHGDDAFRQRSGWGWPDAAERLLLYELGVHYIDLAVQFAGPASRSRRVATRRDWTGNITALFAIIEHDSGTHTVVDLRVDCSRRFVQFEVSGTNHDAVMRLYPEDLAILRGQNTPVVDLFTDFRRLSAFAGGLLRDRMPHRRVKSRAIPHHRLFKQFIAAVNGQVVPRPSDLESALPTFRVLDMLHRQAINDPAYESERVTR